MPEAPDQHDSSEKPILEYAPPPPPSRTGWDIAAFIIVAIPTGAALVLAMGFGLGLMLFNSNSRIGSKFAGLAFFAASVTAFAFSIRRLSHQRRTSILAGILLGAGLMALIEGFCFLS